MKSTIFAIFGASALSLVIVKGIAPKEEVVKMTTETEPRVLTTQEVIEATDCYAEFCRVKDTMAATQAMLNER